MLRRRMLMLKEESTPMFVDLGLPSGLKWAIGNLVKDNQNNYSIGLETDYGCYVSWGNITGHNRGEGYNFNSTTYNATPGSSVTSDISSSDSAHDICLATLGSPWHLPTSTDFQELIDNTDYTWESNYDNTGISGYKFMKPSNHLIYIFIPANGCYSGTNLVFTQYCFCFCSDFNSSTDHPYCFIASNSEIYATGNGVRERGYGIRPVQ